MERSQEYHPNQRYSATLPDTGTTPGDLISSVRFRACVPESPIWKIATMLHFSAPRRPLSTVVICVCSKPWKSDAHFVRFQLPMALAETSPLINARQGKVQKTSLLSVMIKTTKKRHVRQ
ncbi:TPA: hypothetical protein P6383_004983 [Escherichia coli]|nr:hypothetical protein [Escherichia coli]